MLSVKGLNSHYRLNNIVGATKIFVSMFRLVSLFIIIIMITLSKLLCNFYTEPTVLTFVPKNLEYLKNGI